MRATIVSLILLSLTSACGGDDTGGDGDNGGDGGTSPGSGGTTTNGSTGGSSSTGGMGATDELASEWGWPMSVSIFRTRFRTNHQALQAIAAHRTWVTNPELLDSIPLTDTGSRSLTVGDCSGYYEEEVGYVEPEDPGLTFEESVRNAGRLTATFPTDGGALSAELIPNAELEYSPSATFAPAGLFLENGAPGTLTAEGNQIPGFTVPLPFPLALISTNAVIPTTDATPVSTIELSKSANFVLTWERGAPGVSYNIVVASNSPGSGNAGFSCSFDSMVGQGTIDASLLEHLDIGKTFDATTVTRIDVTAGDDIISVKMIREVMTPDKMSGIKLVIVP